ncbi:MAG: stage III sporulation protein AF [Eubacteriales bacterium]|nr:stage III sporulation protein AF [Eubacteriales bacterium]
MAKKNPFIFTIGFNKSNLTHVKAVEILNKTKDKAQLIATAVLYYLEEADANGWQRLEEGNLQPIISELVRHEVKKAMGNYQAVPEAGKSTSFGMDKIDTPLSLNPELTQNAKNALKAFRKF